MLRIIPRRASLICSCSRTAVIRHYSLDSTNATDNGVPTNERRIRSKGRIRSPSRFQKNIHNNNNNTNEPVPQDKVSIIPTNSMDLVKSPDVIRLELKEKYGDNVPESFINEMIQESQNFESNVRKSLRADGTIDMDKYQADDLKAFLQYLDTVIARFYEELDETEEGGPREKPDDSTFMSRLTNMLSSGKITGNVNQTIEDITDKMADHLKPTAREDLIALFNAIADNLKKHNRDMPLELQSRLFNCAIRLPPGDDQDELLYVAGNLIYLNKGLRADPFNEARYINTLIKHKNYIQLEYLWNSRREKDVKGQRFWDEIGILIYIALRNITKLEQLSKHIMSQYGYILPSSVVELIKLHLLQGNKRLLVGWVNLFNNIGNEYGFDEVFKQRITSIDILDSQDDAEGFTELNKPDHINFEDIYLVIVAFLNLEQYDLAVEFSLKYIKIIPNIEDYLLFKFSELPSEIQAGLYYSLTGDKAHSFQMKLHKVLKISTKSELELKQLIFKRFLQRKSPLLSSEEFDNTLTSEDCYSIIKDLTRRGMHKDVNTLLQYMQDVKLEKDKGSTVQYLIPPIASVHYIPILQKFGRHKSGEVVERAGRLLQIMAKVGVRRGQYFHTQFLLTLYRKREFQLCIKYIKESFIEREDYVKSYLLLDTIWVIYRDANRTFKQDKGVRLNTQDIYDLVQFTLGCYRIKPPSVSGVSIVIETLLATQNFPLTLVYLQSLLTHEIVLSHDGFLKIHNVLLEISKRKDLLFTSTDLQSRSILIETIQQNKITLLTKDKKLQTQYQTYDLKVAYRLIYEFYRLFWEINQMELEHEIFKLANDLKVEYKDTEYMLFPGND